MHSGPFPGAARRSRRSGRSAAVGGVVVMALLLAGFAVLLVRAQRLPDGVVPVAFDKTACAHCRMHVGEPPFAAQVQTRDGQVFNFDDPGCMFRWLDDKPRDVHAAYVHHLREERWLPLPDARFIPVTPTPMGFGLGAVDGNVAGSVDVATARAVVRKPAQEGGQP